MNTHEVLDLTYLPDEGQECFAGTLEQCNEFVAQQTQGCVDTYQIVPIIMTQERKVVVSGLEFNEII